MKYLYVSFIIISCVFNSMVHAAAYEYIQDGAPVHKAIIYAEYPDMVNSLTMEELTELEV